MCPKTDAPIMPKSIAPLTDIQIRNAKPRDKSYKLSDGAGMYLEVMPTGAKLWRMKVRQANGRESRLSFGVYPDVSLRSARAERGKVKQQQAQGIDPAQQKRIDKPRKIIAAANLAQFGIGANRGAMYIDHATSLHRHCN
jgi:hypothetical protein